MITIFTGPMFSGKSNRLIDEYEKFRETKAKK